MSITINARQNNDKIIMPTVGGTITAVIVVLFLLLE